MSYDSLTADLVQENAALKKRAADQVASITYLLGCQGAALEENAKLRRELETERACRLANEAQLHEADAELGRLRREVELLNGKRFPILGGGMTVPWQMLAPHEPQAIANHSQSLQRLAERGGLGWAEMLCVLEGRGWRYGSEFSDEQAKSRVLALVEQFEKKGTAP